MLRRPPGEGRRSQQQKLFIAFAIILLPWLQLVDAQQQLRKPAEAPLPHLHPPVGSSQQLTEDDALRQWAATPIEAAEASRETAKNLKRSPSLKQRQQQQHQHQLKQPTNRKNRKHDSDNIIIPNDASALATLAPAQSVRAPPPSRHQRLSSVRASGLASPQIARSLKDWEVEDFVLLATVDGDLYATDRKTGKERWHLEVDQPMVETKHHRSNQSVLDDDYHPVDHYIWAVEPNRDGGLYVWIPDSDAGLVRTGFTMKKLVEDLAPYADEDPPVVYTGDKKTTMITLDAATGRVLKWFGSSGSHVNEAESCLRPNILYDADNGECSSTGTITMGRTEYTVGIQRRDGRAIATLKYSEWSPNNFDNDLYQQHHSSLDSRYITSQHDGKVYAFDYARSEKAAPLFSHKFSAPVARVFDVCRPWDATLESNPDLVVLPQPAMPSQDETIARIRSNSIFLNQTRSGSWYAMSGRAYPLIIDAPVAQISRPEWWDLAPAWDTINQATISQALVGTHFLESFRGTNNQPATLPAGSISEDYNDMDNDSRLPILVDVPDESTIIAKVKSLPQSAANTVVDFISNPILLIIFCVILIYNEKTLRRAYHGMRRKGFMNQVQEYFSETLVPDTAEETQESDKEEDVTALLTGALPEDKQTAQDVDKQRETLAQPKAVVIVDKARSETPSEGLDVSGRGMDSETLENAQSESPDGGPKDVAPEKKKKAHRGRRGGVKHRKGRNTDPSQSRGDEPEQGTVEDAINDAKRLGDHPIFEPDVRTIRNDMQAVTGPIIRMGNIEVNTEMQLGTGSNGTLVFAGKFDGRDVAVKRMLVQFYETAEQETSLLRESDDHPNGTYLESSCVCCMSLTKIVIRYYSQQHQDNFLYIALERCAASLSDVVEKPHLFRDLANAGQQDVPNILYQITNGISHLHALRIVHRDLKPQNILVNMGKDGKPRLLVSDFGLCKKLEGGQSSFGATTGRAAGTSGWRAPELLLDDDAQHARTIEASRESSSGSVLVPDSMHNTRRATRAIDIFSLGLVFFYVLTNGSHPFDCGDRYMREVNIRKGEYSLRLLDSLGDFSFEAKDLIASMLQADPKKRPTANDIMSHPFFWSAKKRLAFLCDVSDHFEKEVRDPPSWALTELERHASEVTRGDFLRALSRDFVDSLGKQRKYTGTRLLDLLRALRNKRNHYEDMSEGLKRSVGHLPEGYLAYWAVRFPMLLLICWNVVYNVQWEGTDRFKEYYEPAGL
ncbi:hypothetical protein G7046_g2738 [Stylonectria norvegica]|nr:hypothetical protein G7046_g2738 [Stylonectria norvegica]